MNRFQHQCVECGKVYSTSTNLRRHVRLKHTNVTLRNRALLKCPICKMDFVSKKKLLSHFAMEHGILLEKQTLQFSSINDFLYWKEDIEEKENTSYVKHHGSKKVIGATKTTFYCHRTGSYVSKGSGKRRLKACGSNKICSTCPSQMDVLEHDSKIFVEFTVTHVGHTNDYTPRNAYMKQKKTLVKQEEILNEDFLLNILQENMKEIHSEIGQMIDSCSSVTDMQHLQTLLKDVITSYRIYKETRNI